MGEHLVALKLANILFPLLNLDFAVGALLFSWLANFTISVTSLSTLLK